PRLEIHDWREAAKFSQRDRDLLLKVSGFSPLGWGSRGIALGADLPHAEWERRIDNALATFEGSPTILQRFHKGRLVEHRYWDADSAELKTMKGRVRLCPYFFVEQDRVKLRGALATIAPADKKFLHGMRDAILTPSRFGGSFNSRSKSSQDEGQRLSDSQLVSQRIFLAIQWKARAGTRNRNTSTRRSSTKNIKTSLPSSFSSVLKT